MSSEHEDTGSRTHTYHIPHAHTHTYTAANAHQYVICRETTESPVREIGATITRPTRLLKQNDTDL